MAANEEMVLNLQQHLSLGKWRQISSFQQQTGGLIFVMKLRH